MGEDEAHEYIDEIHKDGEREGWMMERAAMEEFERTLFRSRNHVHALREAGDMHGAKSLLRSGG